MASWKIHPKLARWFSQVWHIHLEKTCNKRNGVTRVSFWGVRNIRGTGVCIYIQYIYNYIYIHRHVYFRPEMLGCNDYQSQKLHFWEDRMNTADSEEIGPNFEEATIWPTIWISRRRSSREINTSIHRNTQMIKNISSLYWLYSHLLHFLGLSPPFELTKLKGSET